MDEVHGPAHPGAVVLVERRAAIAILSAGERGALIGRAIEAVVVGRHVVVGVDVVAEGTAVFTESALDACNSGTS